MKLMCACACLFCFWKTLVRPFTRSGFAGWTLASASQIEADSHLRTPPVQSVATTPIWFVHPETLDWNNSDNQDNAKRPLHTRTHTHTPRHNLTSHQQTVAILCSVQLELRCRGTQGLSVSALALFGFPMLQRSCHRANKFWKGA
eukprot:5400902-Amphidinium_carterae.1